MRLKLKELTFLAVSGALMFALQVAMAPLPNIEPVSLLVILISCVFGYKALFATAVFVLLEGLLYGFGLWWFFYLYAWPLLTVLSLLCRRLFGENRIAFTILSGLFGLFFGMLYALIFLFTGSFQSFIATWTAGLLFDVLHCAGNLVLCFFLFNPLMKVLRRFFPENQESPAQIPSDS